MKDQSMLEILRKGELEIKQELACIGLELSGEQLKELYQVQQMALQRYQWVETREDRLFDILRPFLKSPYMAVQTYVSLLKQVIVLYYRIRSSVDWHVSDEILCDTLYEEYLFHHGEIDRSLVSAILRRLHTKGEE